MTQSIVFCPKVVNALRNLPSDVRRTVANTLAGELLLGDSERSGLMPEEEMIVDILRFYVRQASGRYARIPGHTA